MPSIEDDREEIAERGRVLFQNLANAMHGQAETLRGVSQSLAELNLVVVNMSIQTERVAQQFQQWVADYELKKQGGVRH